MTSPSGAAGPASYCSNCGAAVTGNFCASCGAPIGAASPPPPRPPSSSSPQQPRAQYGTSAAAGVSFSGLGRTNGMAIGALIAAFLVPPAGFVLALIAKSQIRHTGEDGDGLASAALVISVVSMLIFVVTVASVLHTQHDMFRPGPNFP